MNNLPEKYNHQLVEEKWKKYWQEKKIYQWRDDLPRDQTFVIDTPPPTVSGLLHMGHVFSYTQADFIARYKRMRGFDVFYPMGFDDNGLPTERLVEKILNIKAVNTKRSEFVAKCQDIVTEAEKEFEALFNSIALSVDWDQKYQSISPNCQKISQASFIDLYNKGLAVRRLEPVFWDIADKTALAQADLIDKELPSAMYDLEFNIAGDNEKIIIATTRPELLPACVAIIIHSSDARYKKFHNQKAITPIFGVEVPIITDDLVQLDKGSGAVMCCTFGDETDIKWWKKHQLELRMILGKDGKVIANSSLKDNSFFQSLINLRLKDAKEQILTKLKDKNLLKNQTPIVHNVKCAERSGVAIEILVVPQWFIKILDSKAELKAKANQCNWHPNYMKLRIEQWIDGISWDWCISRQRFFGVAFPVWYSKRAGEEGKILIADISQLPCDPLKTLPKGYNQDEVVPDYDVMDTWATSSITPQLSSHAINQEINLDNLERHRKLFPADLRPQAHEIIRSWAFYTIAKAYFHENIIPWKNLMISGWCLAADKTKMSKSKGNVVTPNDLINEKGSDIVRYWASTSNLGADTAYSEELFKIGQKLLTKLFNAAKFSSMNFSQLLVKPTSVKQEINEKKIFCAADLWILSKLQLSVKKSTEELEKFEYAKAREALEDFFWVDFCDNYLEIVKVRAYGLSAEKYENTFLDEEAKLAIQQEQLSVIYTLYHCLKTILKLFSPFIPHITEELYSHIFVDEFINTSSIHARNSWPKLNEYFFDKKYCDLGEAALRLIFEVRKFKSDNNLSMKTLIKRMVINFDADLKEIIEDLKNVCNCKEIVINQNSNSRVLEEIVL
jgi:valyl-tRNA synthetase